MSDELLRSKNVFGSMENLDKAIEAKQVDAFDILYLKDKDQNPHIGWIDQNGEKVFINHKQYISMVKSLPASGDTEVLYIVGSSAYVWDGSKFILLSSSEGGVDEKIIDSKIKTAKEEANDYTDNQINSIANMFAMVEI